MAGERAMFTGSDNIMGAVNTLYKDTPYYSVWAGKDLLYQFNKNDLDNGRKILNDMLDAAENQENTDLLYIKFHPKLSGGYITNKSEVIGTLKVRAADFGDNIGSSIGRPSRNDGGEVPNALWYAVKEIRENLSVIVAKQSALDALGQTTEREPDMWDRIGALAEKPGVVDGLVTILGPIIQKLIPGAMAANNLQVNGVESPANIAQNNVVRSNIAQMNDTAGVVPGNIAAKTDVGHGENGELSESDNEVIDDALFRLSSQCDIVDCLPKLADFAEKNPAMFKMLLTQLNA